MVRRRWLGAGLPCAVYAVQLSLASLVGGALPCMAGDDLYAGFGIASLPLLVGAPIYFRLFPRRMMSVISGLAFAAAGWLVFFAGVRLYLTRCLMFGDVHFCSPLRLLG